MLKKIMMAVMVALTTAPCLAQVVPGTAGASGSTPAGAPPAANTPAAPASQPTTQPIELPKGFVRVSAGGYEAACDASEEPWVRAALASVKPATRPTTMPADMVANIAAKHDQTIKEISADTLLDPKTVQSFYDDVLTKNVSAIAAVKIRLLYLVASDVKINEVTRAGWSNPKLKLNTVTDKIEISPGVKISNEEQLVPSLYDAKLPADQRGDALAKWIAQVSAQSDGAMAGFTASLIQRQFLEFLDREVAAPLSLRPDQLWFGYGVPCYLSAKYTADLTGLPARAIIVQMISEQRQAPVHAATIDLLHPTAAADLRPEFVPPYTDAMRRKSTAVVTIWVDKSNESAIPKTLAELKKSMPKDGPALLQVIKELTNVDLSQFMPGK